MAEDPRRIADERLAAALDRADVADPREEFRDRLRTLKVQNPAAFREVTAHYESVVLPRLIDSPDPLKVWIDFGVMLAGRSGSGDMVRVDRTGHAAPWRSEYSPGDLLLWLPEDRQADALAVAVPRTPSPAQSATLDLLVLKKLSLRD